MRGWAVAIELEKGRDLGASTQPCCEFLYYHKEKLLRARASFTGFRTFTIRVVALLVESAKWVFGCAVGLYSLNTGSALGVQ